MAKRIKCILLTVLASQITLFFVFYTLKDKRITSVRWSIGRILNYRNNRTNHTADDDSAPLDFMPAGFWEIIGWGANTEDEFMNETDTSNAYTQQYVERNSKPTSQHSPIIKEKTTAPPKKSPENQPPFQQIDDKNIWMYSAYYDHMEAQQGKPVVRVIGIVRNDLLQTLYCNFSIGNASLYVAGGVSALPEHHGKKHHASYLQCNLPANVRPTHVSITSKQNTTTTNRFQIIYPAPRSRNFTVCYAVLYGNYNMASLLIQSIEVNRMLGAEHFMLYNYSISPDVNQILQSYQEDGLVTVLPWPVPTLEVHYYGQMAAVNDCNHRNRNISRFVVIIDTDEFVIPRKNVSWMELIDSIAPHEYDVSAFVHPSDPSKKGDKTTGDFEFRSSFFSVKSIPNWTALPPQFNFSKEERKNTVKFNIVTLSQVWRSTHIFPARDRTKYIARPEHVYICGIHFVHVFMSKMKGVVVQDSVALVHHYRKSDLKDTVNDTSILKFKNQIYPRVLQQYKRFPNVFA